MVLLVVVEQRAPVVLLAPLVRLDLVALLEQQGQRVLMVSQERPEQRVLVVPRARLEQLARMVLLAQQVPPVLLVLQE